MHMKTPDTNSESYSQTVSHGVFMYLTQFKFPMSLTKHENNVCDSCESMMTRYD